MIRMNNPRGMVTLTNDYFAELVSAAAKECFGVVGMATGPRMSDNLKTLIFGSDFPERGVRVTEDEGQLEIELHIQMSYGLNIRNMTKSITQKVKYAVEEATGLPVSRIDVCVDDIV